MIVTLSIDMLSSVLFWRARWLYRINTSSRRWLRQLQGDNATVVCVRTERWEKDGRMESAREKDKSDEITTPLLIYMVETKGWWENIVWKYNTHRRASSYGAPLLFESKFCKLIRSKFSISSLDDDTTVLSDSGFMTLLISWFLRWLSLLSPKQV